MPKSGRVYADTPQNRALGRVGKPFGSAVASRPKAGQDGSGQVAGTGQNQKAAGTNRKAGTSKKAGTNEKAGTSKKAGKDDLGPGPSATGHRAGDTRRRRGDILSVEEVDRRLQALGVPLKKLKEKAGPGKKVVGKCVRAAIQKGYIKLKGEDKEELNQVIFKGTFPDHMCGHSKDVKLSEVLYQDDYAGVDYVDGSLDATVVCEEPGCKDKDEFDSERGRMYLTMLCTGEPRDDDGKFHNHCTKCPGFGVCIGDYTMAHCNKCNDHYFKGFISKYRCPCIQGGGFHGRGEGNDSDTDDSLDFEEEFGFF